MRIPSMREAATALMASPEIRRFGRFLAVGLLNTLFGYSVFAIGVVAGLAPELALLLATLCAVFFNFMTTGRLVFGRRDNARLVRFVLVYAATYCLNALALRALVTAGIPPLYAQPLLLPVVVIITFTAMRVFVFQETTR